MKRPKIVWAAAVAIAACGFTAQSRPALAEPHCHVKAIKATGATSRLESGAKSKARSAWIKRVTASRKLGPSYSAWLRARHPNYICRKVGKLAQCDAVAIPCRI